MRFLMTLGLGMMLGAALNENKVQVGAWIAKQQEEYRNNTRNLVGEQYEDTTDYSAAN